MLEKNLGCKVNIAKLPESTPLFQAMADGKVDVVLEDWNNIHLKVNTHFVTKDKSIVKIDLVAEQPTSLWMNAAPNEYGFYANVNPDVPHPRWSQSTERRISEFSRRKTLPFNGYADKVAQLYAGMDLQANY